MVVLRSPIHANEPSEYNGMLYRTSNRVLNNGIKVIILICMDGTSQYHHHPKVRRFKHDCLSLATMLILKRLVDWLRSWLSRQLYDNMQCVCFQVGSVVNTNFTRYFVCLILQMHTCKSNVWACTHNNCEIALASLPTWNQTGCRQGPDTRRHVVSFAMLT